MISTCTVFPQATIKGKILGDRDTSISFFRTRHPITWEIDGIRHKVHVEKNGRFEITLPEENIGVWFIERKGQFQSVHLMKGKIYELHDSKNDVRFSAVGENADDFNYLSYYQKLLDSAFFKRDSYDESLQTKDLDSAFRTRKRTADFENEVLAAYKGSHIMSDAYFRWLKAKYHYTPYVETIGRNRNTKMPVDSATIHLIMQNGIDDDYAALNCEEYIRVVSNYYLHYKYNGLTFPIKMTKYFDFAMGNTLKGITKEVVFTRLLMPFSTARDSIYSILYEKYSATVQNSQLKNYINIARNTYLENLERSKHSNENVSKSASLSDIFNKYKGKIVYIDFWASWCAPCTSEMKNAAGLKKKLADKDVVFVYLGYKDQKENWLAARKKYEIQGEHYLLNDRLIEEANQLFRITGIPHYVILDKKGNVVSDKADRPLMVYQQLLTLAEDK